MKMKLKGKAVCQAALKLVELNSAIEIIRPNNTTDTQISAILIMVQMQVGAQNEVVGSEFGDQLMRTTKKTAA